MRTRKRKITNIILFTITTMALTSFLMSTEGIKSYYLKDLLILDSPNIIINYGHEKEDVINSTLDNREVRDGIVSCFPVMQSENESVKITHQVSGTNYTELLVWGFSPEFISSIYISRIFSNFSRPGTPIGSGKIMVSSSLADQFSYQVGDELNLTLLLGQDYDWTNETRNETGTFEILSIFNFTESSIILPYNEMVQIYLPGEPSFDFYRMKSGALAKQIWIFHSSNTVTTYSARRFLRFYDSTKNDAVDGYNIWSIKRIIYNNYESEVFSIILVTLILLVFFIYKYFLKLSQSHLQHETFLYRSKGFDFKYLSKKLWLPDYLSTSFGVVAGYIGGMLLSAAWLSEYENLDILLDPFLHIVPSLVTIGWLMFLSLYSIVHLRRKYKQALIEGFNAGGREKNTKMLRWSQVDTIMWIIGLSGIFMYFLVYSESQFYIFSGFLNIFEKYSDVIIPLFPVLFIYSNLKLFYLIFSSNRLGRIKNNIIRKFTKFSRQREFVTQNSTYYKKSYFYFILLGSFILTFSLMLSTMNVSESNFIDTRSKMDSGGDFCIMYEEMPEPSFFSWIGDQNLSYSFFSYTHSNLEKGLVTFFGIDGNISESIYILGKFHSLDSSKNVLNFTLDEGEILVKYDYAARNSISIGENLTLDVGDSGYYYNCTVVGIFFSFANPHGCNFVVPNSVIEPHAYTIGNFIKRSSSTSGSFSSLLQGLEDQVEFHNNGTDKSIEIAETIESARYSYMQTSPIHYIRFAHVTIVLCLITVFLINGYTFIGKRNIELSRYCWMGFGGDFSKELLLKERVGPLAFSFMASFILGIIGSIVLVTLFNIQSHGSSLQSFIEAARIPMLPSISSILLNILLYIIIQVILLWINSIQIRKFYKNINFNRRIV